MQTSAHPAVSLTPTAITLAAIVILALHGRMAQLAHYHDFADRSVVFVASPDAPAGTAPIAVDELRLSQVWAGEAVLLVLAAGSTRLRRRVAVRHDKGDTRRSLGLGGVDRGDAATAD